MTQTKLNKTVSNSSTVAASAYWHPFSETDAPTDYEISNYFPMKAISFENLSGSDCDIILDPAPITSPKVWRVPGGSTLTLKSEENITFHQVVVLNQSASTISADKLKIRMRNY